MPEPDGRKLEAPEAGGNGPGARGPEAPGPGARGPEAPGPGEGGGEAAGRLWLWPTLSPRGRRPPGPAWYLTWPGWERHRTLRLGESPRYPDLSPWAVEEPEGFSAALAALAEAAQDGVLAPSGPPFAPPGAWGLRRAIESGGRAAPPAWGRDQGHLLLALWSAADSARLESDELLSGALSRREAMLASLTGEARPDPQAAGSGPPPPIPAFAAEAWLRLAGPSLRPGDRLWSPWPEAGQAAGLAALDLHTSIAPGGGGPEGPGGRPGAPAGG
jgi:hypothetical protein